jgi:hypothetical protein
VRKAYTVTQKAEAIALAVTAGAEYAAEQLGMDVRTVRVWAARAGKAPELAAPETGWRGVLDLAMARVSTALAGNSVRPKDAAVIAAIASRNIRDKPPEPEPPTEAQTYWDEFLAAVQERWPGQVDLAMVALIKRYDGLGEQDTTYGEDWAYLESLGDLEEWRERDRQEERARMEAQLELNRQATSAAQLAALDAETRDLVAAAEAWLEATNDAA